MKKGIVLVLFFPAFIFAQPFTKKYLLAFHTCTTNCAFQFHETHIAESNDGLNWSLVPNLPYLPGSVPDIVIRGSRLYLYNPGKVTRYDNSTGAWDASPSNVNVTDTLGNTVNFVDPSPMVDQNGNLVLFFLNSTGSTGDPASCNPYPCTKYFDSAVEVPGSDGTQFILQPGHRLSVTLSSGTGSDPDIYFDGSQYILYYSAGSSTKAFFCPTLHGSYSSFPGLTNDEITNQGGIPCGYYDPSSGMYWTFVHANVSGITEIKRVIHGNFNAAVNSSVTVISGSGIGLSAQHKCESPGFCLNDFLLSTGPAVSTPDITIFPNPASEHEIIIRGIQEKNRIRKIEILSSGGKLEKEIFPGENVVETILKNELPPGIYFVRLYFSEGSMMVKKLII